MKYNAMKLSLSVCLLFIISPFAHAKEIMTYSKCTDQQIIESLQGVQNQLPDYKETLLQYEILTNTTRPENVEKDKNLQKYYTANVPQMLILKLRTEYNKQDSFQYRVIIFEMTEFNKPYCMASRVSDSINLTYTEQSEQRVMSEVAKMKSQFLDKNKSFFFLSNEGNSGSGGESFAPSVGSND